MTCCPEEPTPSWVIWARALVLSCLPRSSHSWHPHSSAPPASSSCQLDLFEPDPFAGTCEAGRDRMGGSGACFTALDYLMPSGLTSSQVLPASGPSLAPSWAGRPCRRGPCSGGFRAVTGGLTQHWWLSHRDRGGPCLPLPGGRLPQPAWRQEAAADPQLPVSVTCFPTPPSPDGSPPHGEQ